MDFICSSSFLNEPLISGTFLGHSCHHFWVGATAKQQQTHPKVMTKMVKKYSKDQRFIPKRNATYKIHTLAGTFITFVPTDLVKVQLKMIKNVVILVR